MERSWEGEAESLDAELVEGIASWSRVTWEGFWGEFVSDVCVIEELFDL